jgi:hypothetical protein
VAAAELAGLLATTGVPAAAAKAHFQVPQRLRLLLAQAHQVKATLVLEASMVVEAAAVVLVLLDLLVQHSLAIILALLLAAAAVTA